MADAFVGHALGKGQFIADTIQPPSKSTTQTHVTTESAVGGSVKPRDFRVPLDPQNHILGG